MKFRQRVISKRILQNTRFLETAHRALTLGTFAGREVGSSRGWGAWNRSWWHSGSCRLGVMMQHRFIKLEGKNNTHYGEIQHGLSQTPDRELRRFEGSQGREERPRWTQRRSLAHDGGDCAVSAGHRAVGAPHRGTRPRTRESRSARKQIQAVPADAVLSWTRPRQGWQGARERGAPSTGALGPHPASSALTRGCRLQRPRPTPRLILDPLKASACPCFSAWPEQLCALHTPWFGVNTYSLTKLRLTHMFSEVKHHVSFIVWLGWVLWVTATCSD